MKAFFDSFERGIGKAIKNSYANFGKVPYGTAMVFFDYFNLNNRLDEYSTLITSQADATSSRT